MHVSRCGTSVWVSSKQSSLDVAKCHQSWGLVLRSWRDGWSWTHSIPWSHSPGLCFVLPVPVYFNVGCLGTCKAESYYISSCEDLNLSPNSLTGMTHRLPRTKGWDHLWSHLQSLSHHTTRLFFVTCVCVTASSMSLCSMFSTWSLRNKPVCFLFFTDS